MRWKKSLCSTSDNAWSSAHNLQSGGLLTKLSRSLSRPAQSPSPPLALYPQRRHSGRNSFKSPPSLKFSTAPSRTTLHHPLLLLSSTPQDLARSISRLNSPSSIGKTRSNRPLLPAWAVRKRPPAWTLRRRAETRFTRLSWFTILQADSTTLSSSRLFLRLKES